MHFGGVTSGFSYFVNSNHLILLTAATKLALIVHGTILNVGIPARIVLVDEQWWLKITLLLSSTQAEPPCQRSRKYIAWVLLENRFLRMAPESHKRSSSSGVMMGACLTCAPTPSWQSSPANRLDVPHNSAKAVFCLSKKFGQSFQCERACLNRHHKSW